MVLMRQIPLVYKRIKGGAKTDGEGDAFLVRRKRRPRGIGELLANIGAEHFKRGQLGVDAFDGGGFFCR